MPRDVRHSSASQLWITPPAICTRVHRVFGRPPDLDPATSWAANIFMEASRIMTEEEDSLVTPWDVDGNTAVWLNPPGGVDAKNKSMTGRFWARLMEHYDAFGHAMFMCFNLNVLQVTQNPDLASRGAASFPLLICRSRLRFWHFDERGGLLESKNPSHPNAIVYVPGQIDRTRQFAYEFGDLGDIVSPYA